MKDKLLHNLKNNLFINWENVVKLDDFNDEVLLSVKDYIKDITAWRIITQKYVLNNLHLIDKLEDKIDWFYISARKVKLDFIKKYSEKIEWKTLLHYNKFSIKFIENNYDKFELMSIIITQKLPSSFIIKHFDEMEKSGYLLSHLCREQILDEDFINEYFNRLPLDCLIEGRNITSDLVLKNVNKFKGHIEKLCDAYLMTTEIVDKMACYFDDDYRLKEFIWRHVCEHVKLSDEVVKNHVKNMPWVAREKAIKHKNVSSKSIIDNVKWFGLRSLSLNKQTPFKVIVEFKDTINWDFVCMNHKFTKKQLIEVEDYINWGVLSRNSEIDEELIEKHKNAVDWNCVVKYKKLSKEFKDKYMI